MRVAMPIWEQRISPVFDTARRMLIADVEGNKVTSRFIIPFPESFPPRRAMFLRIWGIKILICGGISAYLARMMSARGIRVIPGIRGGVDEILNAFCRGNIPASQFAMPGWRGWRRKGYGRGKYSF
jgi:predicted Fe-Mo cluster-binding NifX family protein